MNINELKKLDRADILAMLGLETKSSTASWLAGALGTFGAGLVVGAGLALMLTPKPGRELRGAIRDRMRHCPDTQDAPVKGHNETGSPCQDSAARHTQG